MNVLIIEDEPASAQRLKKMAEELDPGLKVTEILDSIAASVELFPCESCTGPRFYGHPPGRWAELRDL